MLILDARRHLVLMIVFLATVITELAWFANLWGRRYEEDARDEGGFFYNLFRYYNRGAFVLMYIPCSYLVERFGIRASLTTGMVLTAFGLWMTLAKTYTFGCFLIASGAPFIVNLSTLVSGSWYGPRGRTIGTMILLVGLQLPRVVSDFLGKDLRDFTLILAILSTSFLVCTMFLVWDLPELPPTMSEDERERGDKRHPQVLK